MCCQEAKQCMVSVVAAASCGEWKMWFSYYYLLFKGIKILLKFFLQVLLHWPSQVKYVIATFFPHKKKVISPNFLGLHADVDYEPSYSIYKITSLSFQSQPLVRLAQVPCAGLGMLPKCRKTHACPSWVSFASSHLGTGISIPPWEWKLHWSKMARIVPCVVKLQ